MATRKTLGDDRDQASARQLCLGWDLRPDRGYRPRGQPGGGVLGLAAAYRLARHGSPLSDLPHRPGPDLQPQAARTCLPGRVRMCRPNNASKKLAHHGCVCRFCLPAHRTQEGQRETKEGLNGVHRSVAAQPNAPPMTAFEPQAPQRKGRVAHPPRATMHRAVPPRALVKNLAPVRCQSGSATKAPARLLRKRCHSLENPAVGLVDHRHPYPTRSASRN